MLRGFTAFDTFLQQHPEFRERVTFIAHLQPSRQDVPEYAEYLERIEALVAVVNHRHGTTDWMPIDLRIYENFPEAVARYKHFDLLMVNSIFDGMNLVAKEAPAVNTRDGVVMLSENTGAHEELGDCTLTVNPFDIQEQADTIHRALTMERRGARACAPSACARSSATATPASGSTSSSTTSTPSAPAELRARSRTPTTPGRPGSEREPGGGGADRRLRSGRRSGRRGCGGRWSAAAPRRAGAGRWRSGGATALCGAWSRDRARRAARLASIGTLGRLLGPRGSLARPSGRSDRPLAPLIGPARRRAGGPVGARGPAREADVRRQRRRRLRLEQAGEHRRPQPRAPPRRRRSGRRASSAHA